MSRSRSLSLFRFIFLLLLAAILIIAILLRQQARLRHAFPSHTAGESRVIDGDTYVDAAGHKVRLLGIDTPEHGEPYFSEAKNRLAELIDNKSLRIETGREAEDRYGRTLAYVFVDTLFVNKALVEEGLARTYFFEDEMTENNHVDDLCKAQQRAHHAHLGVWSLDNEHSADRYFGNPKTMRFHRPNCNSISHSDTTELVRSTDRGYFIDLCYSPCRNCKP